MATITQTIPSLVQGISQAPDEQKLPGQVRNAENVVPDLTEGLAKRPGLEFVKTLTNVQTGGNWFHYYRDQDEGSYVGQVAADGTVRVWRCSDGFEMTVTATNNPAGYLGTSATGDIKALTINDATFLLNSNVQTALTSAVAPSKPDTHSAFIELKQLVPRRSYALNIFDSNATPTSEKTATVVKVTTPTIKDDDCSGEDCVVDIDHAGSRIFVHSATGIAVRVTATGTPYVGEQDHHDDHLHIKYFVHYTVSVDLLYGGSYTSSTSSFNVPLMDLSHNITISKTATSSSRGNIHKVRPVPIDVDSNNTLSAAGVLNSIKKEIDDQTATNDNSLPNITATIIGNGIYLVGDAAFNVEAVDSDLFNIITDNANDVASLPKQCKHGYIVKVTNTADTEDDDYYLKFVGDNGQDGTGYWEECAGPGVKTTIDPATMPYVLKRISATEMSLDQYKDSAGASAWGQREVGDDNTNKAPSFIGNKINKLLFHRDRLAILSGSNIILSRPNNLGNFWNNTALTFSGIDRIDLSCSSQSPNALVEGLEINTGLLLFSEDAQFLFSTELDVLNPETAKIYTLSNYNYNVAVPPISLGTSVAFVDNAGKFSRFFEMLNISRESQPEVLENSKSVQRLMSKDMDSMVISRENSFISICKTGTNTAVAFKYFQTGEKRLQGAWFIWKFAKNITHQFIVNDEYYVVTADDELCKLQLMDTAAQPAITQDGVDFDVHLDYYQSVAASALTFNAGTGVTTLTLPTDTPLNNGDTVSVVVTEDNNNLGRYATGTVSSGTVALTGDWSSDPVKVGREYEMKVELPTIYPTKQAGNRVVSDTSGSLIVQRLKFNFGPVGQFTTKLERVGKPDFIDTHESSLMDAYKANTAPNVNGSFRTIPVYDRNTNVSVTISSSHPSPANIESMSWEGEYTNRFYKRI